MTKKRFLVLCTANRCRSQMAEGWLRHFAGEEADIFSAGVKPSQVHPLAISVMAEVGVEVRQVLASGGFTNDPNTLINTSTTSLIALSPCATAPAKHAQRYPARSKQFTTVSPTPMLRPEQTRKFLPFFVTCVTRFAIGQSRSLNQMCSA